MIDNTNTHVKWLLSVVGGFIVLVQAWSWVENRIERRITSELKIANDLADLSAKVKDTETWAQGRLVTQDTRLEAMQRELTTLRQDTRDADTAIKLRMDAMTKPVELPAR